MKSESKHGLNGKATDLKTSVEAVYLYFKFLFNSISSKFTISKNSVKKIKVFRISVKKPHIELLSMSDHLYIMWWGQVPPREKFFVCMNKINCLYEVIML